jgi:ubiquinone/menaquinone biosynthesis C-methylase UbiE
MLRIYRCLSRTIPFAILSAVIIVTGACSKMPANHESESTAPPLRYPDFENSGDSSAGDLKQIAKKRQSVYKELAAYLVHRFKLTDRKGIGIDIGGGSGDLVLRLAEYTKQFYWINTDLDTGATPIFAADALEMNLASRTGFLFADACSLPFKNEYADIVVSRGSYQFWSDLGAGLAEINRVLCPGGVAFVGRGVAPTMREQDVQALASQNLIGGPKYDPDQDAETFRSFMHSMHIRDFEVIRHTPADTSLNYGVWLYFRKNLR